MTDTNQGSAQPFSRTSATTVPDKILSIVVAVLMFIGLAACTGRSSGGNSAPHAGKQPVRVDQVATVTSAERRYGVSPSANKGIVYQPDVVIIGGGADSVRHLSDDGLVWTIAGDAPHADQLRIGKIMLVTGLGAGRVHGLSDSGRNKRVVIGPVTLTDVVKDGDIASSAPIPLGASIPMHTLTASSVPAAGPHAAGTPRLLTPRLAARATAATVAADGDFRTYPVCCQGGAGVTFTYNHNGGRLRASVSLDLDRPTIEFKLIIRLSGIVEASVKLHGAGALKYDLSAATANGRGNFKSPTIRVPLALTIPLGGPIPLTIQLTQSFDVTLRFGGEASLEASGAYAISGEVGYSYGTHTPANPGFSVQKSILQHTKALGVSSNEIALGYTVRLSVGIGIPGFSAGVWYQVHADLDLVADGSSALTSLTAGCVKGSLSITGQFGVGYEIPQIVADLINGFLGLLNAAPRTPIKAVGGPSSSVHTLWKQGPGQDCLERK